MTRALFEKKGNGIWISHLDLMRLFQRSFKRANLPLTHTQGFNPRPSVSIALPLSVGVESSCELLDFELDGASVSHKDIRDKLNVALPAGVRVLQIYESSCKIKELAFLDCVVNLEYDGGVPNNAVSKLKDFFEQETIFAPKKSKSGEIKQQNIAQMIRNISIEQSDSNTVQLHARVCCQNPTLNPTQLVAAIETYLPELKPDFAKCARLEIYNKEENIFR